MLLLYSRIAGLKCKIHPVLLIEIHAAKNSQGSQHKAPFHGEPGG